MTEKAAMSFLGLKLSSEGKDKTPIQVTDYSEAELLHAFRETCTLIGKQLRLTHFQWFSTLETVVLFVRRSDTKSLES